MQLKVSPKLYTKSCTICPSHEFGSCLLILITEKVKTCHVHNIDKSKLFSEKLKTEVNMFYSKEITLNDLQKMHFSIQMKPIFSPANYKFFNQFRIF